MIIETRSYSRAGLLGNPSDGYFGKTLSIIVRNFGASVSLYETPELRIEEMEEDKNSFRSVYHLVESVKLTGYYGGLRLVKAAVKTFVEYCQENNIKIGKKNFSIRYRSSIPRQVGLGGSSAIISATMKALMKFYEIDIPQHLLPSIILKAENQELGINAGLQDRVIQVYEGCVFMDFEKEYLLNNGFGKYTPVDPLLLPKIYLAYKVELGKVSGTALSNIKERYEKGDSLVVDTLAEIGDLAEQGRDAILNRDYDALNRLINRNFDLRCKIMDISESNMELVMTARKCNASAKFSGSGGAIIGLYKDDETLRRLIVNLRRINARVIKPIII